MAVERARLSLHVYNARCALTIDPSRNRAETVHTVNLETAARPGPAGDFDWDHKLVVQVTGNELADVVAVLLGHRHAVEFLYHGPRRDKGYRLFRDGARFVVQIFDGSGQRHSVSLADSDRLAASVMLFRQLQRNHGGLPADVLYAMIERIYRSDDTRPTTPSPVPAPSVEATSGVSDIGDDREASDAHARPEPGVGEPRVSPRRSADSSPAPDPYDW